MKYVFVGDIHGKLEEVERALDMDGHKVFVGDFMDSFERPTIDHERALFLALDASEKGEATLLYGNHELSYLMPQIHRCSGYRGDFQYILEGNVGRIKDNFKVAFKPAEDWLVTHAGLHPKINAALKKPFQDMTEQEWMDEFNDRWSPIHAIGHYRGGRDSVGGIFWCDFNQEFQAIDGLNQIFGHTRQEKGIQKEHGKEAVNYCIDCLDKHRKFLELDL